MTEKEKTGCRMLLVAVRVRAQARCRPQPHRTHLWSDVPGHCRLSANANAEHHVASNKQ